MPSLTEWKVPPANQPRPGDYSFDLDRALSSVVGLHSIIPPDAFSAETLGTERAGNGVLIDDGLVLTIGYLITEAEAVWLHRGDGRVVEGHALGFDSESGFGLVQALGNLDLDPLPLGSSTAAQIGDPVVVGGAGGRTRSVASRIAAKQEFAGRSIVLKVRIFRLSCNSVRSCLFIACDCLCFYADRLAFRRILRFAASQSGNLALPSRTSVSDSRKAALCQAGDFCLAGNQCRSGGVMGRGHRENAASNPIAPRRFAPLRFNFFTR